MSPRPIDRLREVMRRLRDPERGCPWDLEQDFDSIAPYTIEEAYEVADAIARRDFAALEEELGDLLLQVVYHSQMAEERGLFDFDRVAEKEADKLIRRHPHIFGEGEIRTAREQLLAWEETKARERAQAGARSALDGVPVALPALLRALKLQERAARVGFDWPKSEEVLDKIEEEVRELRTALRQGRGRAELEEEIGDLLFAVVNLARHLEIDPEGALRAANAKFERRFREIERRAQARGLSLEKMGLEAMDRLWEEVKAGEGEGGSDSAQPRPGSES